MPLSFQTVSTRSPHHHTPQTDILGNSTTPGPTHLVVVVPKLDNADNHPHHSHAGFFNGELAHGLQHDPWLNQNSNIGEVMTHVMTHLLNATPEQRKTFQADPIAYVRSLQPAYTNPPAQSSPQNEHDTHRLDQIA